MRSERRSRTIQTTVCAMVLVSLLAVVAHGQPDAAEFRDRIAGLRRGCRYAEAAELAQEYLGVLSEQPQWNAYEIDDARILCETLDHMAHLSDDARSALALADSLSLADDACWEDGRYDEGEAAVRRQLAIRLRYLDPTHPDVAASLQSLAGYCQYRGDYQETERLLRDALEAMKGFLSDGHPLLATILNNLAAVLYSQARYAEAIPLYREALPMLERNLPEHHPNIADCICNLGNCLTSSGDYVSARPLLQHALAIRREWFGPSHPDVAGSLNSLGFLLHNQGDYDKAESLYREALAIRRAAFGDSHRLTANSLNNLGLLFKDRGDLELSESFHREALEARRAAYGGEHPAVAIALDNLGSVMQYRGEPAAAETLFRQAIAMKRRLLHSEHPLLATSLNNLGVLLSQEQRYKEAEALLAEASEMWIRSLGSRHPDVSMGLVNVGLVLRDQGRAAEAEPLLREAAASYETARLRAGMGMERTTFRISPYPYLATLQLDLGKTADAWVAAERGLARTLTDLMLASHARNLTPLETASEESLRMALSQLQGSLSFLCRAAERDTAKHLLDQIDATRDRLIATEGLWDDFQRVIAAEHPISEGQTYPLERVQAALTPTSALVGWLDASAQGRQPKSWGYVIRDSGAVHWALAAVPDSSGTSFGLARAFGDSLRSAPLPRLVTVAKRLWSERLEPLSQALVGVEHLVIIPSGPMLGIPIEALVDDQGVYMLDRYAVSYVPSATVGTWLAERAREGQGERTHGALLIGDPPFNRSHLDSMPSGCAEVLPTHENRDSRVDLRALQRVLAGNEDARGELHRLELTRKEICDIARVYPNATILLGADASEQYLVSLASSCSLRDYRVIHIATHAGVDDRRPERSAFVLSLVDLPDPLESARTGRPICDGLVTAAEITLRWELDADLVTLSGCETGLGKKIPGEGYVGFAQALFQAGARTVLVSLWSVTDRSTSLLMRRFYENWTGAYEGERDGAAGEAMPKAIALREAKMWLRDLEYAPGVYPDLSPRSWAAFILIGDGT